MLTSPSSTPEDSTRSSGNRNKSAPTNHEHPPSPHSTIPKLRLSLLLATLVPLDALRPTIHLHANGLIRILVSQHLLGLQQQSFLDIIAMLGANTLILVGENDLLIFQLAGLGAKATLQDE